MRRLGGARITLLVLMLLALSRAWAEAQPAAHELDVAAIDAYVEAEMRGDRVPGAALAIVHDGEVVYLRGYGDDGHGRAVTPNTSFVLGSISKSFTALAVMQLAERGLIALDAPAQRYLPWFRVADPAASAQISVRHLLHHTSGIPPRAPQANAPDATLEDHVRALAGVRLDSPPGARHSYSSPNYLVLGAIVEQVSGERYAAYVEQQIFAPLGMRHSFTSQERALQQGMAQGHRYWFGFPAPATLPHEEDRMPTAALISSAGDLARYLLAQLNGGSLDGRRLLSPAGVAEMQRPAAPGDGFSYAMGWRVGPIKGVPAIHHGGIVPHFRGKLVLLPEQRWGVAVLTNASTGAPLPIMPTSHRMADAIAAHLAGQPLASSSYSQFAVYLAFAVGMALVLLSQIKGLLRLDAWRAAAGTRPRGRVRAEIGAEFGLPLLIALGLPALLGLPWGEIWRATPDLASWLAASAALSLLTGALKAPALRSGKR
jgi:CubicO group peptidase (beta-lactamase class C family)